MTSNKLKERGGMKWLVIHSEDESTPEIRVPGDFKPVLIREYVGKKGEEVFSKDYLIDQDGGEPMTKNRDELRESKYSWESVELSERICNEVGSEPDGLMLNIESTEELQDIMLPMIDQAISTERQRVLDEVRELVEGMKKVGTEIQERQWCKCGNLPQSKYCDNCRRKVVFKTAHRFTDNEYAHNQALDDLLSALKELERTYFDYLVRPDMIDEQ